MITQETLKDGLTALDVHPKSELENDRMIEVIEHMLSEYFDVAFECPTCGKDLPETERCFFCGEFFEGVEEETKGPSRQYANMEKVDGEQLLAKLIRFFEVSEVRRGDTVISFWQDDLGCIVRCCLMQFSLKVEFPYTVDRIANGKKLGARNYKTPRHGYPSRLHIRKSAQINPELIDALQSVKALRAQEKITAPKFRNRLEQAAMRHVLKKNKPQ